MMRKMGLWLMLAVLVAVGLKGFASYSAIQLFEHFKQEYKADLSISYSWVSVDYQGRIEFQDLTVTPFSLKRSVHIDEFSLSFGNIVSLLKAAPGLQKGLLPEQLTVGVSGLRMPFKGRGLDEWLSLWLGDKALVPFSLHACGASSRVDFEVLKRIGIDEIVGDGELNIQGLAQHDELKLTFDAQQIGKFELQSSWGAGNLNSALNAGEWSGLSLNSATWEHQDSGYYRRLANYCTQDNGLDQGAFAELSAQSWRVAMAGIGILLNESAQAVYAEHIRQGGILKLHVAPPKPVATNDLMSLLDQDLVQTLGLSASLNGESKESLFAYVDGSYYRPAPEQKKLPENKESVAATVQLANLKYQQTDYDLLPTFLERKVRIKLKEGKDYEGLLKTADDKKLEVTLIFGGGTADYSFKVEKIETVEVWR